MRNKKIVLRYATGYKNEMIKSFKHKALGHLHEDGRTKGLPPPLIHKLENMLTVLHYVRSIDDLEAFPGWRCHALHGDLKGFYSLRVTGNWRLIFRFEQENLYEVNLVDYH